MNVARAVRDLAELTRQSQISPREHRLFVRSLRQLARMVSFGSDIPYEDARRRIFDALA